jgi:uracil-DNA glycosylase
MNNTELKLEYLSSLANTHPPLADLIQKTPDILPSKTNIFRCLTYFPPSKTKVIIIGQDPYPTKENACGLAFSVENGKNPPSLRNIFKELHLDIGGKLRTDGNLESWAEQGVLLINTVLTTLEGKSGAHANLGWESYTKRIIEKALSFNHPIVVMAWGNHAKNLMKTIQIDQNTLLLQSGHPSPLAGKAFFGNNHFSKCNDFLKQNNIQEIDWLL